MYFGVFYNLKLNDVDWKVATAPSLKCVRIMDRKYECTNGYPKCTIYCKEKICLRNGSRNKTAEIVSACPKYHPQNAEQCCYHKNDAYCTCIIRATIDTATSVYDALGGKNANIEYHVGAC